MPRRKGPPDLAKLHFGSKTDALQFRATPTEVAAMDKAMAHVGIESRSAFLRQAMYTYALQVLEGPSRASVMAAHDEFNRRQAEFVMVPAPQPANPVRGLGDVPQVTTLIPRRREEVQPPAPQLAAVAPPTPTLSPAGKPTLLEQLGIPMYAAEAAQGPMALPLPDDMDDWT